jgi:hypothetical protein
MPLPTRIKVRAALDALVILGAVTGLVLVSIPGVRVALDMSGATVAGAVVLWVSTLVGLAVQHSRAYCAARREVRREQS